MCFGNSIIACLTAPRKCDSRRFQGLSRRFALSRAGSPPYNLSVCFADSSPCRGASGEEARLSGMPRPPLDRSNGDDRRQRRKQGGAVGAAASRMQATAQQTLGAATRAVARRRRDGEVFPQAGAKIPLEPPLRGGFSLVLRFLFYPEQSAEQPPQTLGAFEHDHLHSADHLSLVFYAIIGGRGAECDSQLRIGPSGTVSTTTSAPFRVEMVMQSEPSAYSLLTPRG